MTLSPGQSFPFGIAAYGGQVYRTNSNDPGAVLSVPSDGGMPSTLVAGRNAPTSIAVDATSVYWTDLFVGIRKRTSTIPARSETLGGRAPLDRDA